MVDRHSGRAFKKYEIAAMGGHARTAAHDAYNAGYYEGAHGSRVRVKRNPYPAGTRHDNWDRGFWHGRDDRSMGRTSSYWRD